MSKPLELTVYPLWDNGFGDLYADKDDPEHPTRVDFEVYRKRLTDTELAAEWWRQAELETDRHHFNMDTTRITHQLRTIKRFATCPDYDTPSPAPLTTGTP